MTADNESEAQVKAKLNGETSRIAWDDLQRFFATGAAISVDASLDLIDVAYSISQNDSEQLKRWMAAGSVQNVSDTQAQQWLEQSATLWAVVVAPWVLVQDKPE